MKISPREPIYRMAEQLSLPNQALGASQIEITGSRQILLCGHKGIRYYSETEIIVDLRDCAVRLQGSNLGICSMTRHELLLGGVLDAMSFLR